MPALKNWAGIDSYGRITPEYPNILVDRLEKYRYNIWDFGVWRSLVSRLVRVQEASGSNPDTPTKNPVTTFVVAGFLFCVGI